MWTKTVCYLQTETTGKTVLKKKNKAETKQDKNANHLTFRPKAGTRTPGGQQEQPPISDYIQTATKQV